MTPNHEIKFRYLEVARFLHLVWLIVSLFIAGRRMITNTMEGLEFNEYCSKLNWLVFSHLSSSIYCFFHRFKPNLKKWKAPIFNCLFFMIFSTVNDFVCSSFSIDWWEINVSITTKTSSRNCGIKFSFFWEIHNMHDNWKDAQIYQQISNNFMPPLWNCTL